jgi:ERCC4-type nuclease
MTPREAVSPFTVLVDTSEQLPYSFQGLRTDAREGNRPLTVRTRPLSLMWGDYSIDGYADRVAVERKTAVDLAGTITRGRQRFGREMEALSRYDAAWVVVESELSGLAAAQGAWSNVSRRTMIRSVMFWQLRYPRVHWWGVPGRDVAQAVTYQLLRTWWRERIETPRRAQARALRGKK